MRTAAPPNASANETSGKRTVFGRKSAETASRPLVSSSSGASSRSSGTRENSGFISSSTTEKAARNAATESEISAEFRLAAQNAEEKV